MSDILSEGPGYSIYLDEKGELCVYMNTLLKYIMTGGESPILTRVREDTHKDSIKQPEENRNAD